MSEPNELADDNGERVPVVLDDIWEIVADILRRCSDDLTRLERATQDLEVLGSDQVARPYIERLQTAVAGYREQVEAINDDLLREIEGD